MYMLLYMYMSCACACACGVCEPFSGSCGKELFRRFHSFAGHHDLGQSHLGAHACAVLFFSQTLVRSRPPRCTLRGRPTEAEPLEPLPVVCRQRRHQPQGLVRCGVAHPQRVGVQQQPRARRVRLGACAVLRVPGDGAAGVLCVQPDLVHPPADGARLSRARVWRGRGTHGCGWLCGGTGLAQRGAVGALQHAKARERLLRSQRLTSKASV